MANETPTQQEAMEIEAQQVKVALGSGAATEKHTKLAHVLATLMAGAIALCVSAVLADGQSVIKLKDPQFLPVVTNPAYKKYKINHRLDDLLGPTYGVGLHHDQSGNTWTEFQAEKTLKTLERELGIPVIAAALPSVIATDDLKHPVAFLECNDLQMAGLAAVSFGFIAESVAVVMVLFHALCLAGLLPNSVTKPLASLIWLVLSAGFTIVVCLAIGIYTAVWKCDNTIVPEIRLSDHFDYSYGFGFAILGTAASVLTFATQLCCTTNKPTQVPCTKCTAVKTLVTVLLGTTAAVIATMCVAGALNSFRDQQTSFERKLAKGGNPCEGQKQKDLGPGDKYFANVDCLKDTATAVLEQAGANVTRGYRGLIDASSRQPITVPYSMTDLCPVNVHWHLGAEHLSVGQFDEAGTGPANLANEKNHARQLAGGSDGKIFRGFQCHHFNPADAKFTTPFNFEHCEKMQVGQTYEIHWPHSAAGACGTIHQYQTPFYDGVFCKDGVITVAPLNTFEKIGVQGQVFTIVNSDAPEHQYDNLINGMIVNPATGHGVDMGIYTGSTTGTSRDNTICSRYTPITWQVDRKCHLISARSWDKMCADMKAIKANGGDDMKGDLHPHGARKLVARQFTANNQISGNHGR